ncbi:hypothetical protein DRJ17_02100 [Candidatus Woesearchaeota archaeon]|nr:MAG: hypothetical protein DRJ17_02100 [Candidatus Woesearchaeota archaeon]
MKKAMLLLLLTITFFLFTVAAARADECHLYSCYEDTTPKALSYSSTISYGYEHISNIKESKKFPYKFRSRLYTQKYTKKHYYRVWESGKFYRKNGVIYSLSRRNAPHYYGAYPVRYSYSYSSGHYKLSRWRRYNPVGYDHGDHRSNLNAKHSYRSGRVLKTQYNRGSMPNRHGLK